VFDEDRAALWPKNVHRNDGEETSEKVYSQVAGKTEERKAEIGDVSLRSEIGDVEPV
jgi:hypothetical protein